MARILLFLIGIISLATFAQDGSLDTSFGDGGIVIKDLYDATNFSTVVKEQSNLKVISGGFSYVNGTIENSFFRYNLDGSIDTSFGNNGILITPIVGNLGLNFQQNGKIIISGSLDNSTGDISVMRYLDNGTIDNTFATNGVLTTDLPEGFLYKINLLDDDAILLTGASNDNSTFSVIFQKYLPNGNLDLSFGNNGTLTHEIALASFTIEKVEKSANNSYILALNQSDNEFEFMVLKFTADYTLDNNFGTNGISTFDFGSITQFSSKAASYAVFNDGSIYIAGGHGKCQDSFTSFHAKLKPDGQRDNSFGNDGIRFVTSNQYLPGQVIIQENNRVLISGSIYDCFEWDFATISRYFSSGFVDDSFNLQDTGREVSLGSMELLADGKIVIVGSTPWYVGNSDSDFAIARYNNTVLSSPEFESRKITVYPNPSNGIFTVEHNFNSEKESFQITDIIGKTIANGELDNMQTQIDLSSASSGVYFLKTSNSVFRLLKY
ncbi:MAG: T9SS type A sorting domain-containing protein [Aequorivita sp.]